MVGAVTTIELPTWGTNRRSAMISAPREQKPSMNTTTGINSGGMPLMLQEHARADGIVGGFVDQDKGTRATIVFVTVTADRLCQTQIDRGDVIHL